MRLGRAGGALAYVADLRHRRIAIDNLRHAFGPRHPERALRRLARGSFAQMGENMAAFLRVPVFIRGAWRERFRIEGRDNLDRALARGRGVIFVLSHFGNWEYLAFLPRLLGFAGAAIGQEIKNPAIDGLIKDIREEIGLELFPKFEVASVILGWLRRNGAVAILADQRARRMGVTAEFFGRPVATTAAPAILAIKSGAALLPAFIYAEGAGRYHVVIPAEIEIPRGRPIGAAVAETARRINRVFEERIRERPELWLWGHRRWKPPDG